MIQNISRSLADLLGEEYISAVCAARSALTGQDLNQLLALGHKKVDFYPEAFSDRQNQLAHKIGTQICPAITGLTDGAPSASFGAAQHNAMAPLGGLGCYRVGEDGRLYFAGKSEHYHIPLGHNFPGHRLVEYAKELGISNATHNNARGYVTRLAEKELIMAANGLMPGDDAGFEEVMGRCEPGVLNRVINLETGSLAVEAALKMMLARFYSIDGSAARYQGRIPVFLVMADNAGGITAGYHGTTVLAQTLRGLWPAFEEKAEAGGLYKVVSVAINDPEDIAEKLQLYNTPPYKTAGFCHEIIMMNYGGIRLKESYLQQAYRLAHESDTPCLCDEIQSCAWYEGMYLFRQYGIHPDFVSIGKGFPGGAYPASKILASACMDNLNQFGALVTNGQEDLASLCYLITLEFLRFNGEHVTKAGQYYHRQVCLLAENYPGLIDYVEGDAHMTALCFKETDEVVAFCRELNSGCIDISAQTYKPNCPPVALTKLPLIVTRPIIDEIIARMDRVLAAL